jgi:NADP-dependent 3-hydroxy acid dehydrogenase YdfG
VTATADIDRAAPLVGRAAIVTGASRGIGAACASALADAGAMVTLAARRADTLEAHARAIVAAGGQAIAVPTDVTDQAAVARLVERAVDESGRLDVAVNVPWADEIPLTIR